MKKQDSILSLHQKTIAAANAEKAATFHLLECLFEMDQRCGHLELGFSSLFHYIQHGLGYSSSQSYERMSAMRIVFKVTEVAEKLKTGELTLTTAARLSRHMKREKLPASKIVELAEQVAGKSVREVERVLASSATQPVLQREIIRPVTQDTSQLKIVIDKEFEELLKEAKELESDPTLTISEVLKRALRSHIEKKKRTKMAATPRPIKQPREKFRTSGKNLRYTANADRRVVWQRAASTCEFVSQKTGLRCGSKQSLEIDHIKPIARGGISTLNNLQLLCRAHNQWKGVS